MEKIIKLKYPLEFIKEDVKTIIDKIKVTRLKAKHLKALPDNLGEDNIQLSHEQVLNILSSMNDLDKSILEELDLTDFTEIVKEMKSFL